MHIGQEVASIAFAIDKDDFSLRVIEKDAAKFASRVACATDNTYSYHMSFLGVVLSFEVIRL